MMFLMLSYDKNIVIWVGIVVRVFLVAPAAVVVAFLCLCIGLSVGGGGGVVLLCCCLRLNHSLSLWYTMPLCIVLTMRSCM